MGVGSFLRGSNRVLLFNTFISPFLFAAVITIPLFIFNLQPQITTKLIGLIDLSGRNIKEELQRELNRSYRLNNQSSEYLVMNIAVGNSKPYKQMLAKYEEIKARLDSISQAYEQIKTERMQYYKIAASPTGIMYCELLMKNYKTPEKKRNSSKLNFPVLNRPWIRFTNAKP